MAGRKNLPIDYTNLGYDALRAAMLDRAREVLPEWNDFSENDLGVLLVELVAYASDITLYYQTRIANNLFPATTDEPEILVQLLRFLGYELQPPAPASADLALAFDAADAPPFVIPAGAKFTVERPDGQQLRYETPRAARIETFHLDPPDARNLVWTKSLARVAVVEGETVVDDPVAVADGTANQRYPLRQKPVIAGSIQVRVSEPGVPPPGTFWREVDSFVESGPTDRDFLVQRDVTGAAMILFGGPINGMAPPRGTALAPVRIQATYRVGGGPRGNVPARTRFTADPPVGPSPPAAKIREATNPEPAAGGMAGEDPGRARDLAPRLFRAQERSVTLQDYADLALRVPGVGKARALAANWNQIVLLIAPSGRVAPPSELLQRDLLDFFERRRMASTLVSIVGPTPADIYLAAVVHAKPNYLRADVRAAVENAVAAYLDFDAVDFDQQVYLSKMYDLIQDLPEVLALNVVKFSRDPVLPPQPADLELDRDIEQDGIIELAPHELPRPGYRDNPDTPPYPVTRPEYRPPIVTLIVGGAGP